MERPGRALKYLILEGTLLWSFGSNNQKNREYSKQDEPRYDVIFISPDEVFHFFLSDMNLVIDSAILL
jgi:hypothetical protein